MNNLNKLKKNKYIRLMRLDKPIGILLLLWPTLWAVWTAGQGHPSVKIIIIFTLGVIIMRSAGCIINDIADREIDKYVKRTKTRPITAGEVSVKNALILFFGLLIIAFVLVLQLNLFAILLSVIALNLACLYPFTKRFLYYPQLFLGLAFAASIPMAFAAELNYLPVECWVMFAVGVLWPLMYDTQYAMVDREDDIKLHVKSTAILLGKWDVYFIGLLQAVLLILLFITGLRVSLIVMGGLFGYQLYLIKNRDRQNCFKAFLNNQWVGLAIFLGSVLPWM
ncbi:MAG TPA: 4-hydroxybenzoate octaprenyltransferase [Gammaproteobacteria bacterium]|nr:4-hydroxybenzoate octaprenyltransferase [Gammaproteobacteria bacterium]